MDKRFDPAAYEQKWQQRWAEAGYFAAESRSARQPYCIMIPPPNVTGRLHMGHALQSAIQDLLVRWRRMQGFNALWLPGTDHAGIATQLMVERDLEAQGLSREELGREAFVERTWAWKEKYQGNIRSQLDLLGASCDWSRERFTLDEQLSAAVRRAFVCLHERGLIRRGEYMVNWSPGLDTAISDLEVEMKTVEGKLYHVAYPIESSDETIVVATTRPETMLGDTAVAYSPADERYQKLAGRFAVLPLVDRRIPFIADEAVDPEFGTGLVKVTPAHDPTDFEIGRRHDLDSIQVIDRRGRMTADAGDTYRDLDRFEARRQVVEALDAQGLLVKVESYTHNVGHCQRSGVPVEPLVSTQWFLEVEGMAAKALEATASGELELVPSSWEKTWRHWLENIRPWCISRQLWWGHQIPAWYTEEGECFVAESFEAAAAAAGTDRLRQDPDVLDTWFSSGLWPFSTLGWPAESDDLATFYPTNVMVTAFDILFFWVARMVMFGLELTGETPFSQVHLTGLVRDAEGQKMSKTKGNTVDPLELVEEFGADALRFTLAALDSPGRDIPLDLERMAGYRSFGNKIWNAVRFVLSKVGEEFQPQEIVEAELEPPERWIRSRLSRAAARINERFAEFRFDEACHRLYHLALFGDAPRPYVREVLIDVLDQSLRLLHPTMPFLTEELWQRLPGVPQRHGETIVLAAYPEPDGEREDEALEASMKVLIDIVTKVRNIRAELGLPHKTRVTLFVECDSDEQARWLEEQGPLLRFLCGLEGLEMGPPPPDAARDRVAGAAIGVVAPETELGPQEKARLEKEVESLRQGIAGAQRQLANEQFLTKAPPSVVEQKRQRLEEMRERLATVESGLAS